MNFIMFKMLCNLLSPSGAMRNFFFMDFMNSENVAEMHAEA